MKWTTDQNTMLATLYGTMPNVQLACLLGHTEQAIKIQALRKGMNKPSAGRPYRDRKKVVRATQTSDCIEQAAQKLGCSAATLKTWMNNFRLKTPTASESSRRVAQRPKLRRNRIVNLQRYWADPLNRERQKERARNMWRDPDYRAKRYKAHHATTSLRMKELWANRDWRERQLKLIKLGQKRRLGGGKVALRGE